MTPEDYHKIRKQAMELSGAYNVEMCYTIWNTFSEEFPEEAEKLQGTDSDCFGNTKNLLNFLVTLKEMCYADSQK